MLIQDNFGYFHDLPESAVVYDGLGYPVGELGDLWDIVKSVGSAIAAPFTAPIQAIGQAVGQALPAIGQALPAIGSLLPGPFGLPAQAVGGLVSSLFPGHPAAPAPAPVTVAPPPPGMAYPPGVTVPPYPPFPVPFPQPTPWPPGWVRPPIPYTGLGPKRMYMRCAVWPGQAGLVPAYAAQAQPAPPVVPPTPPIGPGAMPWAGARHFRRGFHRRRR